MCYFPRTTQSHITHQGAASSKVPGGYRSRWTQSSQRREGNNKKRKTSRCSSTLERSLTKKRRKPGDCVRPNTRKSANTFSKAPRLFYRYYHPSLPFPPFTVIIQLVTLSPRVAAAAQQHYFNTNSHYSPACVSPADLSKYTHVTVCRRPFSTAPATVWPAGTASCRDCFYYIHP